MTLGKKIALIAAGAAILGAGTLATAPQASADGLTIVLPFGNGDHHDHDRYYHRDYHRDNDRRFDDHRFGDRDFHGDRDSRGHDGGRDFHGDNGGHDYHH